MTSLKIRFAAVGLVLQCQSIHTLWEQVLNWEAIGAVGEIVGAAGVVGSLVFVG